MDTLRALCMAAAAVLDTVLLLALLEPRNWRRALLPAFSVAAGLWLWHASAFSRLLLAESPGAWAAQVRWSFAIAAAVGLLLIPCALVHLCLRLRSLGVAPKRGFNARHAATYLPVALIFPLASSLSPPASGLELEIPPGWIAAYLAWLCAAAIACALAFRSLRAITRSRATASFAHWMPAVLSAACAAGLAIYSASIWVWPGSRQGAIMVLTLLPVLPQVLFLRYVLRHNILELVVERSLVYGALIAGVLLFHRLTLSDWASSFGDRHRVDLGIVEGVAVLALILAYQPLRQRLSEALRYLLGARVFEERDAIRRLSVGLSSMAGQPPGETLEWFTERLQGIVGAASAAGWLFSERGSVIHRFGRAPEVGDDAALALHRAMGGARLSTRFDAAGTALPFLRATDASLALKLPEDGLQALVLLGRRRHNVEYTEEEISVLSLLGEELAGALRAGRLQTERLAAERRALQSEKLSALGLLASSIAHEVKNPLSSIKTIATVLAEDLGPGHAREKDVRLILEEVNRLSARTSQLLEFARPTRDDSAPAALGEVVERTWGILRHVAKQQNVALELDVEAALPAMEADEASLKEIVFNLLANGIDAAARGPGVPARVGVKLHRLEGHVALEVHDNGSGIPAGIQDRVFEPFFTTKDGGTGLGLYVVSRRVRELGGEVHLTSAPGAGTSFLVKLPIRRPA